MESTLIINDLWDDHFDVNYKELYIWQLWFLLRGKCGNDMTFQTLNTQKMYTMIPSMSIRKIDWSIIDQFSNSNHYVRYGKQNEHCCDAYCVGHLSPALIRNQGDVW